MYVGRESEPKPQMNMSLCERLNDGTDRIGTSTRPPEQMIGPKLGPPGHGDFPRPASDKYGFIISPAQCGT